MKKTLAIIFISIFTHTSISGCSCGGIIVDIAHINASAYWIKGVIKKRETTQMKIFGSTIEAYKYTVEVKEALKGKFKSKEIIVGTPTQLGACGVKYDVSNSPIYMFLSKGDHTYFTGVCYLNRLEKNVDEHYLKLVADYKNERTSEWYNRNGKIAGKGKIQNGKAKGFWIEYYSTRDSIRKGEGKYRNGKKVGVWLLYQLNFKSGVYTLVQEKKYKRGKAIKTKKL